MMLIKPTSLKSISIKYCSRFTATILGTCTASLQKGPRIILNNANEHVVQTDFLQISIALEILQEILQELQNFKYTLVLLSTYHLIQITKQILNLHH